MMQTEKRQNLRSEGSQNWSNTEDNQAKTQESMHTMGYQDNLAKTGDRV